MNLEETHLALLKLIGPHGATSEKLGEYAASSELTDLVREEYITAQRTELLETRLGGQVVRVTLWSLTPSGAEAIGIDPLNIGLA